MSSSSLRIAQTSTGSELCIFPSMANRHGLITGATGTGKTVSLQTIAESLSRIGVPVFMPDVKGDLSGISEMGSATPKVSQRLSDLKITDHPFMGYPVTFWDVFGDQGHPVRATVSDMGPMIFSRLLNLNDIQSHVLNIVFKIADDDGMLLLDLKDLRSMVQYVGENAKQFTTAYGNISTASIGAIQRGLLALEQQNAEKFFGEPALDLEDLMQTDAKGRGVINILAADKLIQSPQVYGTFLLWMLSELFERLPEAGDLEKPKLVFFFDEAHLFFNEAPKLLLEKIEQVARLIRSKGVGIYFISQNPMDIPDNILGQLGNRVQHALRAFTPKDQKLVKAAAQTFRKNPNFDTVEIITQLGVGEALISFLNEKGEPSIVERALIVPPQSKIGPITPQAKLAVIQQSLVYGHYEKAVDRESAHEKLTARYAQSSTQAQQPTVPKSTSNSRQAPQPVAYEEAPRSTAPKRAPGRPADGMFEAAAKSAMRAAGSQVGRQIMRGILGSILGGGRR